MQNPLIETRGNDIIIDKNTLIMYAVAALVVLVLLVIVIVMFKRRKKNFIKTMPTNLKSED